MPDRLPFQRIAITLPPRDWFHGIALAMAKHYRQLLIELGASIVEVPVDAFVPFDARRVSGILAELRAFRPEMAIGSPYGSYALICRLPSDPDVYRPNLFLDVLQIPVLCIWDHAPWELADQLLSPHPERPDLSQPGATELLTRVLQHPGLIHCSRDSGQTQRMEAFGFAASSRIIQQPPFVLPVFDTPQQAGLPSGRTGVGFIGHLSARHSFADVRLSNLANQAMDRWLGSFDRPLADFLDAGIAKISPPERQELALHPDQTFYWRVAHQTIVHQAQAALRWQVLRSVESPVFCYGNFSSQEAGPNLIPVASETPYGAELSALFARHAITLDILNPGFIHGFSAKQLHVFSGGGFLLMNRKQNFIDLFGDVAEQISYTTTEDLNSKIERFLTNERYRHEVGEAIRDGIRASCQAGSSLAQLLEAVHTRAGSAAVTGAKVARNESLIEIADLLPFLRSEPHWNGASVTRHEEHVRVTTSEQQWSYAAMVDLPPNLKLTQAFIRVKVRVESGRIGIAELDRGATLREEQHVTAGPEIVVEICLRETNPSAILFRNSYSQRTDALIVECKLFGRVR